MVFEYATASDFRRNFCQCEQSLDSLCDVSDTNVHIGDRFSWRIARWYFTIFFFFFAKKFISMSVLNLMDLCSGHAHFQSRFCVPLRKLGRLRYNFVSFKLLPPKMCVCGTPHSLWLRVLVTELQWVVITTAVTQSGFQSCITNCTSYC